MKWFLKNGYAFALALICAVSFFAAGFGSAASLGSLLACLIGGVISLISAPFVHEFGHIVFAKSNGFGVVFWKICFLCYDGTNGVKGGKLRICSPLAPDQTQAVPKKTYEDMKRRAVTYTLGGLIFSGAYLMIVAAITLFFSKGIAHCFLLGSLPYPAYLLLLNLPPFEYAAGKTDMFVACEILKNKPCGTRFIAAMNAQGTLSEGKSYSEIDEKFLENLPPIAENEPLFAMNEFYRYFAAAEKGNYEVAAKRINRIATLSEFLSEREERAALAELTFLNALLLDERQAEKCFVELEKQANQEGYAKQADVNKKANEKSEGVATERTAQTQEFMAFETSAENRAAAAFYAMVRQERQAQAYLEAAYFAAEKEKISGVRASEIALLSQIEKRFALKIEAQNEAQKR